MPRLVISVVFSALVGLHSPLGVTDQPSHSWSADQQAVIDAARNGPMGIETDFDAWARGYHDDWSYWRVGESNTRARSDHMTLVKDYIDAGNRPIDFQMEPVDVIVRGDAALLRLIATETLESPEGERRVVRYASATMMSRHEGHWQILATNIVYLDN